MNLKHAALALLTGSLLLGSSTLAIAEDEHHPAVTPPQQATPVPPEAAPRLPVPGPEMGMQGMMPRPGQLPTGPQGMGPMAGQGGMPMAAMMNQCLSMMGMSNAGEFAEAFPGIGMMQRVEGRIAFLRTELKINETQQGAWTAFEQALRENAKALGETHGKVMKGQASANEPPKLAGRLAAQEEWFAARATGIGELRRALDGLYAVFSDTQKQNAEELLAPHVGMGTGGAPMMSMMSMSGMRMTGQRTGEMH